jgi:Zinc carboxypeptidase
MLHPDVVEHLARNDTLPDGEEMRERIRVLVGKSAGLVTFRQIGTSEGGRPIDLVELGNGSKSALLVGAPHPNEPIGCLTILSMIESFVRSPEPFDDLGFRWSFIPCIEPDGLELNRGWLKSARSPRRYFEHFYRPPLHHQAEYTFPLATDSWNFDHPTQGNLAWRKALEKVRPDLLVSLHNAEYGGVFYMLSRQIPALAERLGARPAAAGLTLNTAGDPGLPMEQMRPGVFHFFDLQSIAKQAIASGKAVDEVWPAGQSSAAYSSERFGTLSLILEVPYWDSPRLRDTSPSGHSMGDVLAELEKSKTQTSLSLNQSLNSLSRRVPQSMLPFIDALVEAKKFAEKPSASLGESAMQELPVSTFNLLSTTFRLFALRPFAMLARVADAAGAIAEASVARETIARELANLERDLDTIPLKKLVELQIDAIVAATEALRSDPSRVSCE